MSNAYNPDNMERRSPSKYNLREIRKKLRSCDSKLLEDCPQIGNTSVVSNRFHVNQLPTEMLSMVFSYLKPHEISKSVLTVCKRWNEIANGPLFWRHLKLGSHGSTESVVHVVSKSTLLESIEIHNRNDFGEILKEIYTNCKQSDSKIKEISLKMCPLQNRRPNFTQNSLNHTQLRKCCDSPHCVRNAVVGGGVINVPYSVNMMEYCPHLTKLTLNNVIIRSKKFFAKIGTNLTSLTELTIIRCHHFSPANLQSIGENCTQLSQITILQNVLYPLSTSLAIKIAWNEAYQGLLKKRGALLQVLEIDAEFVLDTTLQSLSASTRLHTLSLENAVNLSGDGIAAISTLRYLDHLHIHNCAGLHKDTVAQLFTPGNLGLLETLTMTKCPRITDSCLEIVSNSCPRINKVNVSYCRQITDGGVEFLFLRCIKLRYLNLFSTGGIHGSSFQLIPQKTPSLRLLVIEEYCDKVKEKFMKDLIARFPGLQIKRWMQIL